MHVETDIRVVVHGLTPLLRRNGCAVSMTAGIKTKRVHRARSTTAVNPLSCDERLCVFVSVREQISGTIQGHGLVTIILSNLNRFINFFTGRFLGKFAVKRILKIQPSSLTGQKFGEGRTYRVGQKAGHRLVTILLSNLNRLKFFHSKTLVNLQLNGYLKSHRTLHMLLYYNVKHSRRQNKPLGTNYKVV